MNGTAGPRLTVAVLGTGRMGAAMARSIARAGHTLVLFNRTRERAAELARQLDAQLASTPADAATRADVCLTMLADEAAVRDVWAGPDGLLAGARSGVVLVDSSTVSPGVIRSFEARARGRGAGLLDAPVSGSTATAETGQLTLMVGGEATDLERARPALEPLARSIVHMGPLGSGAAMKLAVNTVIFGLNQALAEGLVLAEAAGIEPSRAYDVLAQSAVGAPYLGYKRAAFLEPESTPVAFALDLAEKDLRLITELAAEVGLSAPQTAANLAAIRAASAGGQGGRDFSSVAGHLRESASRTAGAVAGEGSRR